ncbi:MAG: hypothetical protein CVU11_12205 [Bacteroidetes bacterium HGW-Bacteroidetes-6]|jgi:hypothetical protein|nr:MAG: hypothetical protein CVU11_12205 [Bacteroidetes bacterium HGW-Bacteroidetes-6]
MSKALSAIIIAALTIVASIAVIIAYKQTQKIAETKANVQHQIDSLTSISEKYELVRTDFHSTIIGSSSQFKSRSIALGDTMMAEIFIKAYDIHSLDGRKTSVFYQILPETEKRNDLDSFPSSNFFSKSFPIDSSEYNPNLPVIKYIPKNRGKYFLRGYFDVPSLDFYNTPHRNKYPFEHTFEVY